MRRSNPEAFSNRQVSRITRITQTIAAPCTPPYFSPIHSANKNGMNSMRET